MYTHLRGDFMLYIRTYLHSFEKQFHVTYSHIYTFIGKAIFMLHIHWKGNFCTTYSWERRIFLLPIHVFERQFHVICSYFEKYFCATFNIYAYLQSTWLPIQHMYALFERHLPLATYSIYPCTW